MHGCQNASKIKHWLNPFHWKWMKRNLSRLLHIQADVDDVYTTPSLESCKCNGRIFWVEAGVLCFYLEGQHKKQETSSHGCITTSDQMRVVRVVWKATFKHCINQSSSASASSFSSFLSISPL